MNTPLLALQRCMQVRSQHHLHRCSLFEWDWCGTGDWRETSSPASRSISRYTPAPWQSSPPHSLLACDDGIPGSALRALAGLWALMTRLSTLRQKSSGSDEARHLTPWEGESTSKCAMEYRLMACTQGMCRRGNVRISCSLVAQWFHRVRSGQVRPKRGGRHFHACQSATIWPRHLHACADVMALPTIAYAPGQPACLSATHLIDEGRDN